jgi:hypothetical protein
MGFADGKIVERFDCYEGTSAKVKLSKDLYVQGVNFFARKPQRLTTHRLPAATRTVRYEVA